MAAMSTPLRRKYILLLVLLLGTSFYVLIWRPSLLITSTGSETSTKPINAITWNMVKPIVLLSISHKVYSFHVIRLLLTTTPSSTGSRTRRTPPMSA